MGPIVPSSLQLENAMVKLVFEMHVAACFFLCQCRAMLKRSFTQNEHECESNIANKCVLLFPIQLSTLSDDNDQRKKSHSRSLLLGVKEA